MDFQHLPLWAQIILEDRVTAPQSSSKPHVRRHKREVHSPGASESSQPSCLILMAHGSKDPRWRGTFECLQEFVRARYGQHIHLAYMEFVGPTLLDVAIDCHRAGVRRMKVLPLFMAGGAHVATDIPEQLQQVRDALPDVIIEAMPPIGEDPRLFAVIQEIIGEHAHSASSDQNFTAA